MTSFSAFQIFNQSLMSNHNKYFFHLLLLFFTIWFILIKRVCVNSEFVKTYIPEKIWWMALVQKSRVYSGILVVKCKLKDRIGVPSILFFINLDTPGMNFYLAEFGSWKLLGNLQCFPEQYSQWLHLLCVDWKLVGTL